MRGRRSFFILAGLIWIALGRSLAAESDMSAESLVDFFTHLKKGTPVQLALDKGKVVKGLYSSYDDYYDSVWLVPQGDKGLFTEKSYKISGIRQATLWDRKAVLPKETASLDEMGSGDYYLMKQEGNK